MEKGSMFNIHNIVRFCRYVGQAALMFSSLHKKVHKRVHQMQNKNAHFDGLLEFCDEKKAVINYFI